MSNIYKLHFNSLQSFAMVRVILEDVNDNAPEFNSLTYVGRVQENLAPGALVTLVSI